MTNLPRLILIVVLILGVGGIVLLAARVTSPPTQRIEIVIPNDRFPR